MRSRESCTLLLVLLGVSRCAAPSAGLDDPSATRPRGTAGKADSPNGSGTDGGTGDAGDAAIVDADLDAIVIVDAAVVDAADAAVIAIPDAATPPQPIVLYINMDGA